MEVVMTVKNTTMTWKYLYESLILALIRNNFWRVCWLLLKVNLMQI